MHPMLKPFLDKIEKALQHWVLPASTAPTPLHSAMRYSIDAGGKRTRPLLLLATHHLLNGNTDPLPAAVAIECIHTYSLIHDDLPCMDNSPLRRGQPTCHLAFDEATALLAGDALLTHAFYILSTAYLPQTSNPLVIELSKAAGSQALIGGQMEDILAEKNTPSLLSPKDRLKFIHLGKTAALITASLKMGAILADAPSKVLETAEKLGGCLGLAFQIVDDCLDITSSPAQAGKAVGQDVQKNKLTYPAIYGLEEAQKMAQELTIEAMQYCHQLGPKDSLLETIIKLLLDRKA